jgi:hypothetical protein
MLIGLSGSAGNDVESSWNGHVMTMVEKGVVEKIQQRILPPDRNKNLGTCLRPISVLFLIWQE